MGINKEFFSSLQAQQMEAENVAREVPVLTLESEYMWKLLKEFRSIWTHEGLENLAPENQQVIVSKKLYELKDKIDELEKNIKK